VFEHLFHSLVEILDVFVGLVGNRVTGRAPPDQLPGLRVEKVHHQGADFVGFSCCSSVSKAAPAPAPETAVIERIESFDGSW
jgi:hypothetical protein